ncbi:hypothetical protein GCM10020370_20980 [Paenibacillus hodogayensis]
MFGFHGLMIYMGLFDFHGPHGFFFFYFFFMQWGVDVGKSEPGRGGEVGEQECDFGAFVSTLEKIR